MILWFLGGEGEVRDFGKAMYTLLYLKWITNKDLLCSTWNSAQCYVPAWMGGVAWRKTDTCICMAESLHCSPETTKTLLISHTPLQNKKLKKKKDLSFQHSECRGYGFDSWSES